MSVDKLIGLPLDYIKVSPMYGISKLIIILVMANLLSGCSKENPPDKGPNNPTQDSQKENKSLPKNQSIEPKTKGGQVKQASGPKEIQSLLKKNGFSIRTLLADWKNGNKNIYSMILTVELARTDFRSFDKPYSSDGNWIKVTMNDQYHDRLNLALDKGTVEGNKLWELIKNGRSMTTKIHFFWNSDNKNVVELLKISSAFE